MLCCAMKIFPTVDMNPVELLKDMHATPSKPLPPSLQAITSNQGKIQPSPPFPSCQRFMLQNELTKKPRHDLRRHACARDECGDGGYLYTIRAQIQKLEASGEILEKRGGISCGKEPSFKEIRCERIFHRCSGEGKC